MILLIQKPIKSLWDNSKRITKLYGAKDKNKKDGPVKEDGSPLQHVDSFHAPNRTPCRRDQRIQIVRVRHAPT